MDWTNDMPIIWKVCVEHKKKKKAEGRELEICW